MLCQVIFPPVVMRTLIFKFNWWQAQMAPKLKGFLFLLNAFYVSKLRKESVFYAGRFLLLASFALASFGPSWVFELLLQLLMSISCISEAEDPSYYYSFTLCFWCREAFLSRFLSFEHTHNFKRHF